jgi:hypothetical protein
LRFWLRRHLRLTIFRSSYRRLRTFFALRSEWQEFDPNRGSKDGTFASSQVAVLRSSLFGPFSRERTRLTCLVISAGIAKAQLSLKPTEETLQTAFHTMLQMVRCSPRHALDRRTDILLVLSPLVALGKRYRYVLHRDSSRAVGQD